MFGSLAIRKNQEGETPAKAERKVFTPSVNIYETDDSLVLVADVPGVDEKSVEVTLENDTLTLFARSSEEAPEGYELAYSEYTPGDYRRSFAVSSERINRDAIEASVKNGVLKITLPKTEAVKARKIEVKAA